MTSIFHAPAAAAAIGAQAAQGMPPPNTPLDIVGISGSLRARSFNTMALQLAGRCMPSTMALEVVDWNGAPPFNADLLAEGLPGPVEALRERIRRADALLIATPEYNFSMPGMLKNLLDWLSRGEDQPLAGKPVALLSATTGPLGGSRVQYELRRVLLCVNAMALARPEVFIGQAQLKFSPEGDCTDAVTQGFVAAQMSAFEGWISRVHQWRAG